jgi:hypothetical protein
MARGGYTVGGGGEQDGPLSSIIRYMTGDREMRAVTVDGVASEAKILANHWFIE